MKKLVIVLTLAVFALAGAASAQDPNPGYYDNIGVYTDEGCVRNDFCLREYFEVTPVYVVLTELTSPEVFGWEAKFTFENMAHGNMNIFGDAIDAATREGEHIVGLATPLIANDGTVVVASVEIWLRQGTDDMSDPSYIYVDGVYFGALPGGIPTYLPAPEAPAYLHQATSEGHEGGPVFFLNAWCGPVAVEQDTWGGVKSLYR
jgi:hypothetical protein